MASDAVLELTDDNFEAEVINSDVPVLVDFWAEWCQPCRMLAPTIDEIAEQYKGKVDTDSNREIATRYQIQAIPTVMLFNKGQLARQPFVGLVPKRQFEAALNEVTGG
jgi:thioredoxin 1